MQRVSKWGRCALRLCVKNLILSGSKGWNKKKDLTEGNQENEVDWEYSGHGGWGSSEPWTLSEQPGTQYDLFPLDDRFHAGNQAGWNHD